MSNIEERVKKIVCEQLGVKEEEVTTESSFVNDLGADSLDTVELVMALEEEFETLFNKYGPRRLRQEMNWQVTMLAVIQRERETGEKMSLDDIGAFYWTLGLRHEELELHEMEDA